jgi:NADP-dependent 3-hydroxy acid dehydrogenase YdfG
MAPLVWLVTGCSAGFGHELVLQILKKGDNVIATARNASKLDALRAAGAAALALDVTADLDTLKQIAEKANGIYGRIDILVNNAGFVLDGAVEETRYILPFLVKLNGPSPPRSYSCINL